MNWCKPAEEAVGLPLRTLRSVGNAQGQCLQNGVEARSALQIYRLFQIVRGSVVAVVVPVLEDLLFRRTGQPAELERQRRHALTDEAVLVAADEAVVVRHLVRLYFHARGLTHGADVVSER